MSETILQAWVDIYAAPNTVLTTFQVIEGWSTWYPGVVKAGWITGKPWAVDAVMEVHVRNSLGMTVKSTATVLLAGSSSSPNEAPEGSPDPDPARELAIPPEHSCCWENRAPGLVTVCYAWTEATADGSRFTLQKQYSGPAVPLLRLMKGRQERMVQTALHNLQTAIYSSTRG